MGNIITKPWREDIEIEKSLHGREQETSVQIHELELGKMPTAEDFIDLIKELNDELHEVHRELHEDRVTLKEFSSRLSRLEKDEMRSMSDVEKLRDESKQKALRLRLRLGLKEDPTKVDGFAKIRGLLKKYADESEDSVEFLRRAREDE